jgi:hypothetical protein
MVAHLHRLCHLDDLASLLHAENTPLATAAIDRCKADRCLVGKLLARMREIEACTIRAPDLDREILRVFVDPEFMLRPVLESIVAERQCQLAELIVEQRVGFSARRAVGDECTEQRGQHDRGQQRDQQLAAD